MDIFNKRRVRELEARLTGAERERDKYRSKSSELAAKLDEIIKLMESAPTGCAQGPWCKACEFSRSFHYSEYITSGVYGLKVIHVCGKNKSCEHFIQKETADE